MRDAIWNAGGTLFDALGATFHQAYTAFGYLGPALLGLFGGIGATLVWEGLLKPRRERRSIARVLLAENSHNLQMMTAASMIAAEKASGSGPQSVPSDFALSTIAFDALASGIGALPGQVIGEMVYLRAYYQTLNAMPAAFDAALDSARGTSSEQLFKAHGAMTQHIAIFRQTLDKAIHRVGLVQPLLAAEAYRWWVPWERSQRTGQMLNLDKQAETMRNNMAERSRLS